MFSAGSLGIYAIPSAISLFLPYRILADSESSPPPFPYRGSVFLGGKGPCPPRRPVRSLLYPFRLFRRSRAEFPFDAETEIRTPSRTRRADDELIEIYTRHALVIDNNSSTVISYIYSCLFIRGMCFE